MADAQNDFNIKVKEFHDDDSSSSSDEDKEVAGSNRTKIYTKKANLSKVLNLILGTLG